MPLEKGSTSILNTRSLLCARVCIIDFSIAQTMALRTKASQPRRTYHGNSFGPFEALILFIADPIQAVNGGGTT